MRTLTARVVALAVVVALASATVTAVLLTRAITAANRDRAAALLAADAERLADATGQGRRLGQAVLARRLRTQGYVTQAVAPGGPPPVAPFTAQDVAAAAGSPEPSERVVGGVEWLLVGRPAGSGVVVLAARPLQPAVRLSPAQRNRALVGGAAGLALGALGGVVLARSVTRPLARLAAAARSLSDGDRDPRIPPRGPREVTEVAAALAGLAAALRASEERQRRFLMAVSHELRTPLTSVSGYAEGLADGDLRAEEARSAGAVIRDEAARLQRRVEDLLSLARLEADDFQVHRAPTDLADLVRAAAAALGARARTQGVHVVVEAPQPGPVAWTDGERVRQILDALADNALRILPPGAPLVLACGGSGAGSPRAWVEVRDGGPGLSPEDLAVAFERGLLTERYRGSRPVGSGLGLALVAELARRLGGDVKAASAPEGGAAFTVLLPAAPAGGPQPLG